MINSIICVTEVYHRTFHIENWMCSIKRSFKCIQKNSITLLAYCRKSFPVYFNKVTLFQTHVFKITYIIEVRYNILSVQQWMIAFITYLQRYAKEILTLSLIWKNHLQCVFKFNYFEYSEIGVFCWGNW